MPLGFRSAFMSSLILPALVIGCLALFVPPAAEAGTFPGENGKIVFSNFVNGNNEIYTSDINGGNMTRLTNNTTNDLFPSWSPDGSKIAFSSGGMIMVMNADGSNLVALNVFGFRSSWSPDGTKIAYSTSNRIFVVNIDGTDLTQLTSGPGDSEPSWSPDGTKIAFTSNRHDIFGIGSREIYVMNADGSGQSRLTTFAGDDSWATWSPDGTKIAFFHSHTDATVSTEIYVMNFDGSSILNLTNTPSSPDSYPVWSPDGTKIGSTRGNSFRTMNSDGSNQVFMFAAGDVIAPDWQPVNNQPPVLALIGEGVTDEGQLLQFTVTASDPNQGDIVTLSTSNLPSGASFDSQTGIFSWTPSFDDAGVYSVGFVATDNGDPVMSDSETVTIAVTDVNRAPILEPIGNKSVAEGQLLQFTLSATDPDLDDLTFSAANLPAGASFDAQTGTFSWTPTFDQDGNYDNVEFTATDNGSPIELDVELITITVGNVNRAPLFDPLGSQSVLEEEQLTFTVNATDPDNNTVTYVATNVPSGATFNAFTGEFSWTPSLSQAGNYVVTFEAIDNGVPFESGTLEVSITVGDNPTPVEQAQNLIDVVIGFDFPTGVENAYMANLKKIEKFIEEGKITPAINQLDAFIVKVEDDFANGVITQGERDTLVQLAEALLDDLQ